ncbi:hypothetical protein GJAV_G00242550 [Gymnothorax javanicus]|nr:hypothetical protein GJAV_G00242550 [Gymnothorax javanicus]
MCGLFADGAIAKAAAGPKPLPGLEPASGSAEGSKQQEQPMPTASQKDAGVGSAAPEESAVDRMKQAKRQRKKKHKVKAKQRRAMWRQIQERRRLERELGLAFGTLGGDGQPLGGLLF